jgi:Ca2+/Na+ antiporter
MKPQNNRFNFQEFLKILHVNIKVIFALTLFLGVFFALFFGYYAIILIVVAILFILYSLIDVFYRRKETHQEETDGE